MTTLFLPTHEATAILRAQAAGGGKGRQRREAKGTSLIIDDRGIGGLLFEKGTQFISGLRSGEPDGTTASGPEVGLIARRRVPNESSQT